MKKGIYQKSIANIIFNGVRLKNLFLISETKQKQYYNKFNKYFKNSPYQKNLKISATQMRKQAAIFLPPDFTGRMKAKKKKSGKGPSTFQVPETVVDVFLFCFVSYSPILLFLCSFSLSLSVPREKTPTGAAARGNP